ncbi:CRISPR-associated helicase Cas3' [Modicisalibacter sp. 'Wilcox']|uniref:CRISPR-associated helicase Cas3' n=1 Tax=Modicisalibacter sp. 'Wilcox' TaxID=2679914 RepID=UPI0013D041E0|nr:CRISPR-associated helicase Cas3' [Modicisalibacter sp. 'Wilcox']
MTSANDPAWGKTNADGLPSHHLAHHSMDVAAVLEQLVQHPVIAVRLARAAGRALTQAECQWLAAFAFLHDIGKLSPRFQAKAWPQNRRRDLRSHLAEGWRWLDGLHKRGEAMDGAAHELLQPLIPLEDGLAWFRALFAHHGRPTQLENSANWPSVAGYDWCAEENHMGEALHAWFGDAAWGDPEALTRPPLIHLFAGLLALADWIGSDERAFSHELTLDIDGYAARARKRAITALRRVGMTDTAWPDTPPDFEALTGFHRPHGVQALIGELPTTTALAILEAETGSGKTEAALWHFARLRSAGSVDALYFAVPTRAAAWQLFKRVECIMRRIGGPETILAVPGQLQAGEAEGVRLPGFEVRWDDGREHWAAEHATRFLAAPVAVGTIDQVLIAGLQAKHAHLRGAALSRSLLVIDEVHASDTYMNRIARTLVRDHMALGGQALLMSATLGSVERAEWLSQSLPGLEQARHSAYPALWHSGSDEPLQAEGANSAGVKTVRPRLEPTMDPSRCARLALEAAHSGARVLVIRNTVDQAVATWQAICDVAPQLCLQVEGQPALHHSRFAAEDRRRLDAAVERAFGKGAPARPVIAVGTQTLEQSLDIDADILMTDLCPMDVLLQRIGRLHRHERPRPAGFEQPVVHILCPESGLDALARNQHFENGLGAWQSQGVLCGIYMDLRIIEATRRLAETRECWCIPEHNRELVELATHPEALDAIDVEMGWQTYTQAVVATTLAEDQHARMLVLQRTAPFPERFPDADETVQTRLGALGPLWELPPDTLGAFGLPVSRLAPPAHWCKGLSGEEMISVTTTNNGLTINVGERHFTYDRAGLKPPIREH